MDYNSIIQIISNLGVPVGILAYILWRGDKFLTALIAKLDWFNEELRALEVAIRDLIKEIKK